MNRAEMRRLASPFVFRASSDIISVKGPVNSTEHHLSFHIKIYKIIILPVVVYVCENYSSSHSRVAPENVGLQKEQKCNKFPCHTCNEVRLCVMGIRKKEVGITKR
jgi:hypothetical protein